VTGPQIARTVGTPCASLRPTNKASRKLEVQMLGERCTALFVCSATLCWILVPSCCAVFSNCDQMISFFSWHLLKQTNTYFFALASAVQIVIPFRATVLSCSAVVGRMPHETARFATPGPAAAFLLQTAFLSFLAATAGKATFTLDYITPVSYFVWPFELFRRLF
jgi:hypothetical protein